MKSRKAEAPDLTAAKTRHGTASTYIHADPRLQLPTKPRGRRRIDPLAGIWDDEIVPMLKPHPGCVPLLCSGRFPTIILRLGLAPAAPWSDEFGIGRV